MATSVDAAVTNGGVEIELASAPSSGTFDLESVNGGVSLTLPARQQGRHRGALRQRRHHRQRSRARNRRRTDAAALDGKLNGGGARVSLETVNGGVKIERSGGTT